MGLSFGIVCMMLRLAVLIQYRSVTDKTHDDGIASRGKNSSMQDRGPADHDNHDLQSHESYGYDIMTHTCKMLRLKIMGFKGWSGNRRKTAAIALPLMLTVFVTTVWSFICIVRLLSQFGV